MASNESDKKLDSLINLASTKEIYSFEISGVPNENGEIVESFASNFSLRDEVTYHAALLSFSTSSFFPNVTKDNNRFYYSEKDSTEIKCIELDQAAYDVEDIHKMIQSVVGDRIALTITPAGRCAIKLAPGWKIYFNKEKTFRKLLGFTTTNLLSESGASDEMVDIISIQRIYISCNLIRGSYYHAKGSTILFSMDNAYGWGEPINIKVNPLEEKLLVVKRFNEIGFRFFDNNGLPVDFMKSNVCLNFQIRQL